MGSGMTLDTFPSSCHRRNSTGITATQMQHGICNICKKTFGDSYLWRKSSYLVPKCRNPLTVT